MPATSRAGSPARELLGVAAEHLEVGQHVVAEGDRLRHLQVGEAGHDGVGVVLREVELKPLPENIFTKAWLESKSR